MSSQDRDYLRKSAQGANSEVTLGRLAERQARSLAVKRFGSRLVRDHSREKRQLIRVDRRFGLATPNTMLPEARQELQKLRGMRGAEFDREFVNYEVGDHQNDIRDARKEADSGGNPAIRDLARRSIPTLQTHLRIGQSIEARRSGAGTRRGARAGGRAGARRGSR